MTLFWGVFATLFALVLGGLGSVLDLINVIGPMFYPCMLSAFTLAVFCKKEMKKDVLQQSSQVLWLTFTCSSEQILVLYGGTSSAS